jgi:hypothetical protein
MKHKVYKSMLCMALSLLTTMPLLAQSGIKRTAVPVGPVESKLRNKPLELNLNLNRVLADLKLENLDLKLAKLDDAMKDFEIKLVPHLAAIGKQVELQMRDFDPQVSVNFSDGSQPDPGDDNNYSQTAEKVKTLSKSYQVDAKDKLAINNQYGKVSVNTWTKNEIKVDVEIRAYEASDDKAQDLLDGVNISESRQGDLISFKTNINNKNITKNGKESKRGVQINYVVYMPAKNPLDITNRYGSTVLADFDGPVNINSSYGSLTAGDLGNPANRLKVSYGSANIESFSSGSLDVAYGSLKLANADKLNADIRYSSAKIGKLTTGGNLDLSYGDCKIENLDKSIKNLMVNASYSGLNIGIDDAASFNFDVTVSYAGFNFNDDKVNITSKTPDENAKGWNPTKNYKGTYGKGSESRVIIKSNYGGVKFL